MAYVTTVLEVMSGSALRIASENSDAVGVESYDEVQLFLIVASKTGSPTTLNAVVEYSYDGGSTFIAPNTAEAFSQVTGSTSTQCIKLTNVGSHFRVATAMTGGSAGVGWTFSVVAVLKRLA